MSRLRRGFVVVAVCALPLGLVSGLASADPQPQPTAAAFPAPGDGFAAPSTGITLRGVNPGQVSDLKVTGSASGPHEGTLRPLSSTAGVVFDPAADFQAGETVTVATRGVTVDKAPEGTYTFAIATPGVPVDMDTKAAAKPLGSADLSPTQSAPAAVGTCAPATHTYRSRPDLGVVPGACVTGDPATARDDKIFTSSAAGQTIFDNTGEPVWFNRTAEPLADNFQRVELNGQPLLAYYQGQSSAVPGSGQGEYVLLDDHYNRVHTVRAGNGLKADLHEFQLTPQGTALIGSYNSVIKNLFSFGGLPGATVIDYVVQEVELDTANVLFEWHALDHVGIGDSYFPIVPLVPYDYIHGNSIQQTGDGNLLLSARHTWSTYKIDRSNGDLMWTLGGKHSDFNPLTTGADVNPSEAYAFCWQHDARELPDGSYSLFDNGSALYIPQRCGDSRGLQMSLTPPSGTTKGKATIMKVLRHDPNLDAEFAGNTQLRADGSWFLGYGGVPQATLFDAAGTTQLNVNLTAFSYRAFLSPWVGKPSEPPAAVVSGDHNSVYASWNGATEVKSWQVLAGTNSSDLQPVGVRQPRTGFETVLSLPTNAGPLVRVQALDGNGTVLGISAGPVSGSTYIEGINSTAPVGPGTFSVYASTPTEDGARTITGADLTLPPVRADFLAFFGLIPAQAVISLRPVDQSRGNRIPLTGTFSPNGSTATVQATVHLDDLSILGFSLQGLFGPTCSTSAPVTVQLSANGDPQMGSPLTGTFAIPAFAGCGFADGAVTGLLSLPSNTISLTAS